MGGRSWDEYDMGEAEDYYDMMSKDCAKAPVDGIFDRVSLQTMQTDNAAIAEVIVAGDYGLLVNAFGDSRRHPTDTPIPRVGNYLAVARALRQASDVIFALAEEAQG